MMARHTVQLGPATHNAKPPQKITLSFINHRKNQNLNEEYLVLVNPKGQVPAMTGNVLEQPLTDSRSISLHLAEKHYPAMLPAEHAVVIQDLLKRIHAIYGLSFSNKNPTAEMTQYNPSPVEDILKKTDLSPKYRAALEAKLSLYVTPFVFLRLTISSRALFACSCCLFFDTTTEFPNQLATTKIMP
jgi:glutathione S-transferase